MRTAATSVLIALLLASDPALQLTSGAIGKKPMSVHNRLLLNRLAVSGHRSLEVMLMLEPDQLERISQLIARCGGRIRRAEPSLGYVRAEVPIAELTSLVDDPGITAYQISSLSRGAWYRDAAPQLNAEMYRGFETASVARTPAASREGLPSLSPHAAAASGYTADDDVGVGEWLRAHPTYDGRGVTIAFLETGQPEFTHPTLQSAMALDGRTVPKLVGILNALDPDAADETRVDLDTEVRALSAWCRIGDRTYIVPGPGTYRFGLLSLPGGSNIVQQFGVLRDETTGSIRVDTNGDGDFRAESPVADVNTRFEPQMLHLTHPRPIDMAFVVASSAKHRVHIYIARDGHQAMTLSVAAGSRAADGLASGVAPAARVLLVRSNSIDYRLHDFFEGYLEAIKRTDVDILTDSAGVTLVPDTSSGFGGLFFRRLIEVYRKPIFHGAGNSLNLLNGVSALGDVFSVGGSIGVPTFAALYGGGAIGDSIVHPLSVAGPSLDGALKPDFIAPMHRVAADVLINENTTRLPRNLPQTQLPRGYQISCCTSASAPYAAGVGALLVSAAKQKRISYSVETLGRALRVGARFLPGTGAHQQGSGILDVNAAWRELQRAIEVPRIRVRGDNVHALAFYAPAGATGVGLFEREGWAAGSRGRRALRLTRESGPAAPVTYRISWTGNDDTFATAPAITLPLKETISLPLSVAVSSSGVHSAILNLHDPATDFIVGRSAATVVAPEHFDSRTYTAKVSGSVPLMRTQAHYFAVPDGVAGLSIELEVVRGSLGAVVLPSHGMLREYYGHVFPQAGWNFTKGKYRLILPRPAAGTWSITISNDSVRRERNSALVSADEGMYSLSVQLLTVAMAARKMAAGALDLDMTNHGAPLDGPVAQLSIGALKSHRAKYLSNGLPNQFEIHVPRGAATLALHLRNLTPATRAELHLYDCSSGECFSYDFTVPAANEHHLIVRRPAAGRWVAAVNAAPLPAAVGEFVFEEIVAGPAHRGMSDGVPRLSGSTWSETLAIPSVEATDSQAMPVIVCELVDVAAERQIRANPWENRQAVSSMADTSVALAMAIIHLK